MWRGGLKGSDINGQGHERQIRAQAQVGDLDFQWIQEYGAVWRTKTCWNVSQTYI